MPKTKPVEITVTYSIDAAEADQFPQWRDPAYLKERAVHGQLGMAKVVKVEVK